MIIVKIKGGLGNQLFQYAFAKLLEKVSDDFVKLDFSSYNFLNNDSIRKPRILSFKISLNAATNEEISSICIKKHTGNPLSFTYRIGIFLESIFNRKYYLEKNREYIDPVSLIRKKSYFDGYWQSKRYVYEVRKVLLDELVPKNQLSEKTLRWQTTIRSSEAVFVGVRKGDYSSEKKHYGVIPLSYYDKAMSVIEESVGCPVFYVFSNDIEWCKKNLIRKNREIVFREIKDQTDDFEELILMSSCKHAIIANSTFHWWGAFLIENKSKIVCCPSKWFFDGKKIDILEDNWIKIEV